MNSTESWETKNLKEQLIVADCRLQLGMNNEMNKKICLHSAGMNRHLSRTKNGMNQYYYE